MGCSNALPAITIQQLAREVESVRGHTSANSDAEMPQTTETQLLSYWHDGPWLYLPSPLSAKA
ncbi:hypothetical protein A9K55_003536 [Cordyceps militaris]|uniref:Uncharacterized protein n=1 Tax=Cordyceps militaris TaxID=73501 RepID=A0A2H4S9D3_CORMI|nr:hypothetical protein A9K55_003536 [Cordyceps militaris]